MITQNWIYRIDQITDKFNNEFSSLTTHQLNWKPNDTTWSIAQNIKHLIIVNESYFPVLKAVKESKHTLPFTARFNFITNLFGKFILSSVQPDRKRKTKTFPMWEPASDGIVDDILMKFETYQSELKKFINNSTELLDKGAVISSPANKFVVYKLAAAFDIIVSHEERHFEQAKELLPLVIE